jgi:hypothetical protein
MSNPLRSHNKSVASFGVGFQQTPWGRVAGGLVCVLPGVEPVRWSLGADPRDWDEMSTLAADLHSQWRTWGACFDEVVFSYVPQPSLF